MTATYLISGMTCDHCVASVTEEVSEVRGVSEVGVDLGAGRMVVRGSAVNDSAVRAAVAEAGYSAEPLA
jgi:copper chaperone